MKILVIGGSGFIGPWVVRQLYREGHRVGVLHRGNAAPDVPVDVERIHGDPVDRGAREDRTIRA
ncbi:MAG: NAD-dependent epimerase/dehydratase family protein [Terriglobales bacterium]